ncbi:ABC transporter permease [Actinotalea subterranea]|uniref:ABC transporter permease n=1 Tax=Actinotalea subterranea TaxID=2607497 RepID=UPI0011EF2600|nr:ABC transporter permease [Actinotalea subterranea]
MWSFARSALRTYRASFAGSLVIVALASALLTATGVWLESGARGDASGKPLTLLTTAASSFAGTTVLVVVLVVASTFSAALRPRHAQFALLRAVGATAPQVRAMVTAEVLAVFAIAAPFGVVPGLLAAGLMTPLLERSGIVPPGHVLTLSPWPVLGTLLLLVPTGLLAARVSARSVARMSPTAAVRRSAVEPAGIGPVRRASAVGLLVAGLLVAGTPFVLPGALGSAVGAVSAFLLITAAALAGPVVVAWAARRSVAATRTASSGATMLALVNARGFSRRLTAAITPLALFLTLGVVQTGMTVALTRAAVGELSDGIRADLVVTSPDGVTPAEEAAVAATAGVGVVVPLSTAAAEVKVDDQDEEMPLLDGLAWEATGLRVLGADAARLLDPGVVDGSLDDLAAPGTIAVSSVAVFGTGKGVGSTVDLRFDGGAQTSAEIVAVYERGLGFGDYLVDARGLPADVRAARADTLLVGLADGDAAAAASALAALGLESTDAAGYARDAASSASSQELSNVLVLLLVLFVAIAAANTLVMLTGARRSEFALLRRTGATQAQVRTMVTVESAFVAVAALVVGVAAALPALVGVGYGLGSGISLAVAWPAAGVLALTVVGIAFVATVGSAWRTRAAVAG